MIHFESVSKVYRTERIETHGARRRQSRRRARASSSPVMGPSGCGKSTLLNLMGLLDEPSKRARSPLAEPR